MDKHHSSCSPFDKSLVWLCYQCGMTEDASEIRVALAELVARCEGPEGVRADGTNIDTLKAHVALGDLQTR